MLTLAACGGAEAAVKPPAPVPTVQPTDTGPHLVATQELGSIDEQATNATFDRLNNSAFQSCLTAGTKRVEYLAGETKFFVRVGADGHARYSYFEESTLGDYDTERCMLDAVDQTRWPVPVGGEAEVRYSITFDALGDARQPTVWGDERVEDALSKHKGEIHKCIEGVDASFTVTAYIQPKGKKAGEVQAAGVATSNKKGASQLQCVVEAVKSMKMPSPGGYAAKVTFSL